MSINWKIVKKLHSQKKVKKTQKLVIEVKKMRLSWILTNNIKIAYLYKSVSCMLFYVMVFEYILIYTFA